MKFLRVHPADFAGSIAVLLGCVDLLWMAYRGGWRLVSLIAWLACWALAGVAFARE